MPSIQTSTSTPALLSRRSTVLAPPSLSTVTHLSTSPAPAQPSSTSSRPHPSQSHRRRDLNHSLSQPTAASPVSTRENISSSYTATTSTSGRTGASGEKDEGVVVHPTFRADAGEMRGDVLVRVEGVEFFVHKDVLMFASPFFRGALGGGWRENRLSTLLQAQQDVAVQNQEDTKNVGDQEQQEETPEAEGSRKEREAEGTEHVVAVQECSNEEQGDGEGEDVVGSGMGSEFLGDTGVARPRSLLRASYHTGLWSQDDEPPSRSESTFTDAAEALSPTEAEEEKEDASVNDDEDGFEDDETDSQPQHPSGKPSQSPRRNSQSANAAGLRQVRSKSKHLATRLPLRKLESANRKQSIPARSTSKTLPQQDPKSPARERFESLATPPISRRSSDHAPSSTQPLGPTNPAQTTAGLPSPYRNLTSVIDLAEESASTFHDFLYHTYPHLDLSVTWFNCGPLLRFSDKFQVPFLRRSCLTFLRAALAGKPIEAMRLAELHGFDDLYKEASRHVLDNFSSWDPQDLDRLSPATLLKLERKRTWFLERLLKLGLANPARDYECHPNCPDPKSCAKLLGEKWGQAYAGAVRYTPPQPSVVYRQLREAGWEGTGWGLSACQGAARVWVQGLFDRMFELGALHGSGRMFLSVKLDAAAGGGTGGIGRGLSREG